MLNFRGELICDLVAAGVQVHALAPDYDDELRQKIQALGAHPVDFQLNRTGMNPVRDGIDTVRLAALLRRLRPDVTLGYFIKPLIYGTLAAWLAGVPTVIDLDRYPHRLKVPVVNEPPRIVWIGSPSTTRYLDSSAVCLACDWRRRGGPAWRADGDSLMVRRHRS